MSDAGQTANPGPRSWRSDLAVGLALLLVSELDEIILVELHPDALLDLHLLVVEQVPVQLLLVEIVESVLAAIRPLVLLSISHVELLGEHNPVGAAEVALDLLLHGLRDDLLPLVLRGFGRLATEVGRDQVGGEPLIDGAAAGADGLDALVDAELGLLDPVGEARRILRLVEPHSPELLDRELAGRGLAKFLQPLSERHVGNLDHLDDLERAAAKVVHPRR